ncbi:hypothetical protein BDK51DRAFT_17561 [Blyttiomyces helicus]|uniref:Methyltransferase domain-containing protein n=1 Tax=Blyttiomyces helicus TaxID=388810 RepID=A0A4P9WM81_9FUNG|nr:hypothetical protein BDK51DRAFT_17561 [Blyttiomyces helicus]|eukprot:RKO91816.1 hypothetical protein BDK51DRAFT_17561 [Blyttiomyces helicus]
MPDSDDDALPFSSSEDLPRDIPAPKNPIPFTLVNSRPMEGTPFVAPYVPCHVDVATAALRFAHVGVEDVLIDLGCGDARILIAALTTPPSPHHCIGIELDPHLASHIRSSHAALISSSRLQILEADMFGVDMAELGATVAVVYLLPAGLEKLKPALRAWLEGDAARRRVVTITYSVPGWEPRKGVEVKVVAGVHGKGTQTGTTGMGGAGGVAQWLFYYDAGSVR